MLVDPTPQKTAPVDSTGTDFRVGPILDGQVQTGINREC